MQLAAIVLPNPPVRRYRALLVGAKMPSARLGLRIYLDFGTQPGRGQHATIGGDGVVSHRTVEIGSPPLSRASVRIHPVEPGLRVLVFSLHRTGVHLKENMAAVVAPVNVLFDSFIASELAGRLIW